MRKKSKIKSANRRNKLEVPRPRVAVAMSGGVDSSTAAKLLRDRGFDCVGVFMRLGIERGCCDEAAARRVCQKLGIRFYPLDLRRQFSREVKTYFLKAYESGLTPNPCVVCNRLIKFGELLKKAENLGCEYLATGHYIKIKKIGGVFRLFKAADKTKDQSYFLHGLSQGQLKRIIFPLGDSIKEKVKAAARKDALPHLKEESQDVCFLSGDHNEFLKDNLKLRRGLIKTLGGKIIGEHKGLPLYTIGQRKGVEIGGSGPYYVSRLDHKKNVLYVVDSADDNSLFSRKLIAEKVNWISGSDPKKALRCQAVIRYRHKAADCLVKKAGRNWLVEFSEPQRAITPGQSVVFYQKEELLGGGIISGK